MSHIVVDNANDAAIAAANTNLVNEAIARALGDVALDRTQGQAGLVAPTTHIVGSTTLTLVASRAYFVRFVPTRNMSITLLGFCVTTAAGSNDAVDGAIYNATTLAKVGSSPGSTTGKLNATGVQTLSVVASLTAGTAYYAAMSLTTFGGSAAIVGAAQWTGVNMSRYFGNSNPQMENFIMNSAGFPMPATASIADGPVSAAPFIVVRES